MAHDTRDPDMYGRLIALANEFAGKATAYEEEACIASELRSRHFALEAPPHSTSFHAGYDAANS